MYNDEGSGRNGSYGRSYGGNSGRRSSYSGSSEPKPVKSGDEIEVKIEAVASKGDGIAKKDGFVIFIKNAKEGEMVKARITEVKERFAIGEVIS